MRATRGWGWGEAQRWRGTCVAGRPASPGAARTRLFSCRDVCSVIRLWVRLCVIRRRDVASRFEQWTLLKRGQGGLRRERRDGLAAKLNTKSQGTLRWRRRLQASELLCSPCVPPRPSILPLFDGQGRGAEAPGKGCLATVERASARKGLQLAATAAQPARL